MTLTSPRPFSCEGPAGTADGGPTRAVWLRGEHDIATDPDLIDGLAGVISLDDADLVLDLSMVSFIGVSTIGVIERTQRLLRGRSRSLTVRRASPVARQLFVFFGLADLLEPGNDGRSAASPARTLASGGP